MILPFWNLNLLDIINGDIGQMNHRVREYTLFYVEYMYLIVNMLCFVCNGSLIIKRSGGQRKPTLIKRRSHIVKVVDMMHEGMDTH